MLCNYLQNVAAITYIFVLQLSTFLLYNKHAAQSVRIVYRDIGRVDSPMQEGEHAPNITKQITDIEEIKRLLA